MGREKSGMRSILFGALLACCGTAAAEPILVYGDSLSSAYGVPQSAGWVALLGERLKQLKSNYTVVNASISGETSAGGAARIGRVLASTQPAIVIVELGANDGLRGLPVAQMKSNLAAIVQAAKRQGARVILVGMQMPPNYGAQYTNAFRAAFRGVAGDEQPTACLRIGDQLALPVGRACRHAHFVAVAFPVAVRRPGRRALLHPFG